MPQLLYLLNKPTMASTRSGVEWALSQSGCDGDETISAHWPISPAHPNGSLEQCSATGVLSQGERCDANFYRL
jgi:hypothetical protein